MTALPPLFLGGPTGARRWLLEAWEGDADALVTVLGRVSQAQGPVLLADVAAARVVEPAVMAAAVRVLWLSQQRVDAAGWETWQVLFRRAGYIVDGCPAPRPTEPVRLFRGSTRSYRRNVRWTPDRAIASVFAGIAGIADRDHETNEGGEVWTALVEPWRLFCSMRTHGADEVVIDTEGLAIEATHRAPLPPRWAAQLRWSDLRASAQDHGGGLAGVLRSLVSDDE